MDIKHLHKHIFRSLKTACILLPAWKLQTTEAWISFTQTWNGNFYLQHLHIRSFDLLSDLFSLDVFGWRAAAGSSWQGSWHEWRWRLRGTLLLLLLKQVDAEAQSSIRRQISVSQLCHASGELLHACLQVCENGEIHFSLQAGCWAHCDAGTFAFDAQVSFFQVKDLVVLVILWDGAQASLPRLPLWKKKL